MKQTQKKRSATKDCFFGCQNDKKMSNMRGYETSKIQWEVWSVFDFWKKVIFKTEKRQCLKG